MAQSAEKCYSFEGSNALSCALQKLSTLKLGDVVIDITIRTSAAAPAASTTPEPASPDTPPLMAAHKPEPTAATAATHSITTAYSIVKDAVDKGEIKASNAKSKLGSLSGLKAVQTLVKIAQLQNTTVLKLCINAGLEADKAAALHNEVSKKSVSADLRALAIGALTSILQL